jgi:hypothetical protein
MLDQSSMLDQPSMLDQSAMIDARGPRPSMFPHFEPFASNAAQTAH